MRIIVDIFAVIGFLGTLICLIVYGFGEWRNFVDDK